MGVTTQPIPIEGRLQLKLGYDQNTLQLIVTLVCATGLSLRQSGAGRNPYAKVSQSHIHLFLPLSPSWWYLLQVFLLPDRSHKSKRRTKTVGTTCEPRWGQTFLYSGLRRCDLNGRLLEVCLVDFPQEFPLTINHFSRSHCGTMCATAPTTSSARWSSIWPTTYSTTRPSGISCSRIRTSPTSYVLPGTRNR